MGRFSGHDSRGANRCHPRPSSPTSVPSVDRLLCGLCVLACLQTFPSLAAVPDEVPAEPEKDEAFLRAVHHALMNVHLKTGRLECRRCARLYPVANGIPNMLLHEDEVSRK